MCVVGKCFVVFNVFSFSPGVYVGTLNLNASISGPSILTSSKCKKVKSCLCFWNKPKILEITNDLLLVSLEQHIIIVLCL